MKQFYKKRHFWIMVLTALIAYLSFMVLPYIVDIYYSFTKYQGVGVPEFTGLKNYVRLFKDPTVGISIKNTLIATGLSTLLQVGVSFFIAYTLDARTRLNNASKIIIFAPYIIPTVLTALIWLFILSPSTGLINGILESIGLESWKQKWINGPTLSPYSFAFVMSWAAMGFYMTIWQTGIRSISSDVIEASIIDGCTRGQRVRHVILPLLKDTLVSCLIFSIFGGLKLYDIVYMLTGGGPREKSHSIVSYMYDVLFSDRNFGYGSAIAVIEGLIAIVIVFFFIRNSKKED